MYLITENDFEYINKIFNELNIALASGHFRPDKFSKQFTKDDYFLDPQNPDFKIGYYMGVISDKDRITLKTTEGKISCRFNFGRLNDREYAQVLTYKLNDFKELYETIQKFINEGLIEK